MRYIPPFLVLLSLSLFSCGGGAPPILPPGAPIDWPAMLECGPSVPDIISTVSTELLRSEHAGEEATQLEVGPTATRALEELARKYGPDTVACVVDLLQRDWSRPGASKSLETVAAANRARDFLVAVGTEVRSNEAFIP